MYLLPVRLLPLSKWLVSDKKGELYFYSRKPGFDVYKLEPALICYEDVKSQLILPTAHYSGENFDGFIHPGLFGGNSQNIYPTELVSLLAICTYQCRRKYDDYCYRYTIASALPEKQVVNNLKKFVLYTASHHNDYINSLIELIKKR